VESSVMQLCQLYSFLSLLFMLRSALSLGATTIKRSTSLSMLQLRQDTNIGLRMSTTANGLLAVHVKGKLTKNDQDKFYTATLSNARNSVLESGISRFDLLRNVDAPDEFLLVEVYKDSTAPAAHKETQHYKDWREAVEPFMAQPRAAVKYTTVFPPASEWDAVEQSSRAPPTESTSFLSQYPWLSEAFACTLNKDGTVAKGGLLAVVVDVQVSAGDEEAFMQHTLENCRNSCKESGVHRFDLLRNQDDPSNFILVEIYNSDTAPALHKETKHYLKWRDSVADMMARPRSATKYVTLFPSPLYYRNPSTLLYSGDGSTFSSQVQATSDAAGWAGRRGLSTCGSPSIFGFQGPKIAMGRGCAVSAVSTAKKSLKISKPLIVTGKSGLQRYGAELKEIFADQPDFDIHAHSVTIEGEPTVENAQAFVAFANERRCDSVLAIGGGSAVDVGKAVAALIPNKRDIFDYLEVIGKGMPLEEDPLPFIAVPTTSGTGSEATKNAVLKSNAHGLKVSIRHDKMYPDVAILDPMLTLSCPPSVTAHVGMDTLCQVVEPFVSNLPNPFTDAICKEAITRAARSIRDAVADGEKNIEAREDMAVASVMGGMALANAKLGVVHGFAAVLGGKYENAPHGAICAALLPYVFEENALTLQRVIAGAESTNTNDAVQEAVVRLERFQQAAQLMTGNPSASIAEGITWLHALSRDINIPGLTVLCPGIAEDCRDADKLATIIQSTKNASSSKGNPVELSVEQLANILTKAL